MRCSIVLATYNKADILDLTLKSILCQRPPFDFETIVVDDGSTDHTAEVCSWHDGIRYLHLDRSGYCNPAVARNVGYKAARGDVIISQCEVMHHTRDTIERLVNGLIPGHFDLATVWDVALGSGRASPEVDQFCNIAPQTLYCGKGNPRPYFFLGSCFRSDLYAVGGNDEDFIEPGYDDDWFAACLIHGRGLVPRYRDDVVGWHLPHARTSYDMGPSKRVYDAKMQAGVFCSSGGPWA